MNAGAEPDTIDPQLASFTNETGVVMRVFRNLLTFDKDNQLVPDQAAGLPLVEDGGTTLTFQLKPGLVYSDGRPLTARDFEYGWKRHLDPRLGGQYAFTGYIIAGGEEYNTTDPATLAAPDLQRLRDAVGVAALDAQTIRSFVERAQAIGTASPRLSAPWYGWRS